jgi:hypothetical protein
MREWPLEIRALLARIQRPAPRGRACSRRQLRVPFLFEAGLRYEDPQTGPRRIIVHTRDRTDSRISFLTDTHLLVGQQVELDFTRCAATASLGPVPARVRRCRQFLDGWFDCVVELGDTARRPLSWWERTVHWLGEFTGFGPDDRRGHGTPGPQRRDRAA